MDEYEFYYASDPRDPGGTGVDGSKSYVMSWARRIAKESGQDVIVWVAYQGGANEPYASVAPGSKDPSGFPSRKLNPDHPIEVIPEDMDAASFVYAVLTTMGVATTKFKAGPSETYGLMVALVKRAEQQGYDVTTEAAPGLTKVYVRKQTRLNSTRPRGGCTQEYHDYLKSDPRLFKRETIPGGIQEDDVERLEYGHCKKCHSTLALATQKNARCPRCGKSKYFCECGERRTNPPAWVRDESIWARATARIKPKWKQYREPYAAITETYYRMGGRKR